MNAPHIVVSRTRDPYTENDSYEYEVFYSNYRGLHSLAKCDDLGAAREFATKEAEKEGLEIVESF
jgi:hypothetical protein